MTLTGTITARDLGLYGGVLLLGAALHAYSHFLPADMPFWMPWEFNWSIYLACALSLIWYGRGWRTMRAEERPPVWQALSFVFGVLLIWFSLQSRVDYYAQHMFFIHRAQHYVLHHFGPLFIALAYSGPVLWRGMPAFLQPLISSRPVKASVDFIQHPVVAPVIFVGLIYFWLLPSLHTQVMLDKNLYDLMNWTMTVDGIFFWCLILDPRPNGIARLKPEWRMLLIVLVEPLQMVLGAILSFSMTDYFPVYEICGRIMDMTALNDQHYGGLIIWLPGTLQSFVAFIIVLVYMRKNEEAADRAAGRPVAERPWS